jgi:hypothetical protein
MNINVNFDLSLLDHEAKRYEKNLAFSVAKAINAAAEEAQKRIRASLLTAFHVRKRDFLFRSIKIFAFANVGADRPFAELGIDNKHHLILSLFESGGERQPFKGQSVAVPVTGEAARPSITSSVNAAFTFQALHFKRGPITHAGREILAKRRAKKITKSKIGGQYYVWQGAQRTFILPHTARAPLGGVFQRIGPKRDNIRMIYSFRRNVILKKALAFIETSQKVYEDVFKDEFVRRFYHLPV